MSNAEENNFLYRNDGDLDLFVANFGQHNFLYENNGDATFNKVIEGAIVNDGGKSYGASWADYDNDGDLDLFVANFGGNNFLYRNNGDGTFNKVPDGHIVTDNSGSIGASWGDYDNDGDQDLFVANQGNNLLYENNSGESFTPITTGAIVGDGGNSWAGSWGDYDNDGDPNGVGQVTFVKITSGPVVTEGIDLRAGSTGSSWVDFDNDGDLDLFVATHSDRGSNSILYRNDGDPESSGQVIFAIVTLDPVVTTEAPSYSSSWGGYDNDGDLDLFVANASGENNFLYENKLPEGAGFTKVENISMVTDGGDSFGCSWSDYDHDGDLDLFVANASGQNDFFYENKLSEGLGFIKITDLMIVTGGGDSQGGSWGDYDNDGDLDLLVTRAAANPWGDVASGYVLYRNDGRDPVVSGPVHFTQVNILSAEKVNSFGSSWGDFDNDGDLDLIVANSGDNFLFRNDGDDSFTPIRSGAIVRDGGSSIGSTWSDYDNNGFLDLFVANLNKNNFLYQTFSSRNHWLNIHLEGRASNASAIGVRVTVLAILDGIPVWQTREISGQTGCLSQNSLNAEFGLRDAAMVDSIRIEWPSGAVNRFANIEVNQFLMLQENNRPSIANEIPVTTLSSAAPEFVWDLTAEPGVFFDADGDSLTYQAVSSDTSVAKAHLISSLLTVSLVNEKIAGKATITITADDGRVDDGRGYTETMMVDINRPPFAIKAIPIQIYTRADSGFQPVEDLKTVFLDPDVGDGDRLVFNASSQDSSIAIAKIDGSVLKVSPGDSSGQVTIQVTADDRKGGVASSIEFRVRNGLKNKKPKLIAELPNTILIVNRPPLSQELNKIFVDEDGDQLTFTPVTSNPTAAFSRIKDDTLIVEAVSPGEAVITVRANDGFGEASVEFNVEVLPSFRPEISNVTIATSNIGQSITIETDITDDEGALAPVFLKYRMAGEANFDSTLMDKSTIDDTTFSVMASIPASAVTNRGVEYSIAAEDTHGVKSIDPASSINSIRVRVEGDGVKKASAQPGGNEQTGYRLISIPPDLDDKKPESVLADNLGTYDPALWRLFQWVSAPGGGVTKVEFPNTSDMSAGASFWLIVKDRDKFIDSGPGTTVLTAERYVITLNAGWNLIGNPFNYPTVAADTLSDGSALTLRSFDEGGWSDVLDPNTTELQPFEGYAVRSTSFSTMFIKPNPFDTESVLAKQAAAPDDEVLWSIRIQAQCQDARDNNNVAAIAQSASREWDRLDHPEPPGIGEYVSVYFPHPDWDRLSKRFSTDVRPKPLDGEEWEFEVKTNIRDVVNLSFEGLEKVPAEYDIWLVDKALKITTDLRLRNNYSIAGQSPDKSKRLTLVAGKHGYVDEKFAEFNLVPTNYELSQNFPNPFNPVTTFQYGLPTLSRVTLRVYNLLGKEVVTLVNDELRDPGYHVISWNGRSANGTRVASGVYFYQMRSHDPSSNSAPGFIKTRKMLLIE